MTWVGRALLVLLVPFGTAGGQEAPLAPDPPTAQESPEILLAFNSADRRMTVPVAVGDAGPYAFVIDTGAERTVVSHQLAGQLQLAPGKPVRLLSMTDQSSVNTVVVPELAIESLGERHTIEAPALNAQNLGAAGLLGLDTLRDHKVEIDFDRREISVSRTKAHRSRRAAHDDEIVVTGRSLYGQLIVTDAWFGNRRIQVVVDTGSQVTMGNSAFRRLVGRRHEPITRVALTSVTGGVTMADYTRVPRVRVGNVQFDLLPVAFADVMPFERLGLDERPALLLGMDALRSFRHVEIDFPNRQVRFRVPGAY